MNFFMRNELYEDMMKNGVPVSTINIGRTTLSTINIGTCKQDFKFLTPTTYDASFIYKDKY